MYYMVHQSGDNIEPTVFKTDKLNELQEKLKVCNQFNWDVHLIVSGFEINYKIRTEIDIEIPEVK